MYARRHKLLVSDETEIDELILETQAVAEDGGAAFTAKQAELGTETFRNLFRRLALQTIDTLWVEHLEVMGYTRNSVNLRAYGQRDPLIEYRKEGTRLFKEMQHVALVRIAEVIPRLQPVIVEREEAVMKKESEAAQAAAGATTTATRTSQKTQAPVRSSDGPGRNDLVTITNGTETLTVKYKKAEPLLGAGYTIVDKGGTSAS